MNLLRLGRCWLLSSVVVLSSEIVHALPMEFVGFTYDGHFVSAVVEFALDDATDTVHVNLRNTTATTFDSAEVLTGIDFTIGALPVTLSADSAIRRTVGSGGGYGDTGIVEDVSWSILGLGRGIYQLNFNPDDEDGIIGPPTEGHYLAADSSIRGNGDLNPFAAEVANFQLGVAGLTSQTEVRPLFFRFGPSMASATGTIRPFPEPASLALAGMGLIAVAAQHRRRR